MESASSPIDNNRSVNAVPPKVVARYLACSWRSANYAAAWAPARRVCCCSYVERAQGDFAEAAAGSDFRHDDGDVGSCETCTAGASAARAPAPAQGEEQA